MAEKKNICRKTLIAKGCTAWASAWDAAWDAASCTAVAYRANDPAEGRKAWAAIIKAAMNTDPSATNDATWDAAWDAAWTAAWSAAIAKAPVGLEERQVKSEDILLSSRSWDAGRRIARHATGRAAGCEAWNAVYNK